MSLSRNIRLMPTKNQEAIVCFQGARRQQSFSPVLYRQESLSSSTSKHHVALLVAHHFLGLLPAQRHTFPFLFLSYLFETRIHCEPRLISTCLSSSLSLQGPGITGVPAMPRDSLSYMRQQVFSGQLASTLQAICYCFTGPGPG